MENKKRVVDFLTMTLLTFFGSGKSPYAPGTMGSLCCIPFLYFLNQSLSPYLYFLTFLILLIVSTLSARYQLDFIKDKDPGWIVIDEVLGMMVAWPFLKEPFNFLEVGTLFCLFRFFDISKIWPASFYDKKKGPLAIMMDDIVSGIYVAICMITLRQYLNFPEF